MSLLKSINVVISRESGVCVRCPGLLTLEQILPRLRSDSWRSLAEILRVPSGRSAKASFCACRSGGLGWEKWGCDDCQGVVVRDITF
jgi:hypothetical protein